MIRFAATLSLVALFVSGRVSVFGQAPTTPSSGEIEKVIAEVSSGRRKGSELMPLRTGGGALTLGVRAAPMAYYTTPLGRVASAAIAAQKRYLPFAAADVTNELLSPGELQVYASAVHLRDSPTVVDVVTIVVMPHGSKERSKAIQPLRTVEMTETFRNLIGYVAQGRGLMAAFPLSVLSKANDVHVVYERDVPQFYPDGGSRNCTDCVAQFEVK